MMGGKNVVSPRHIHHMPPRAQQIIWKLYSPPRSGVRQVIALSRSEAEKLPRLDSMAVISITAPGRPPAYLDGFEFVLRLSFADIDFLRPALSKRAGLHLEHSFDEGHATAIRVFVDALPVSVKSIIVHCEGGYSRSCAVALALHELYDYEVDQRQLVHANPSILALLKTVMKRR